MAVSTARLVFEACVDSVTSARRAAAAGAHRLELCSSLVEGGITPSMGLIKAVCEAVAPLPVHVLIRPRAGDFTYDEDEVAVMEADAAGAIRAGAAGIVIGPLSADGTLDVPVLHKLIEAAKTAGAASGAVPAVTFHRAVDVCADWRAVMTAAAGLGVNYILTSGCAPSALEGAAVLRDMLALAQSLPQRVEVIAAGGVTPATAGQLLASVPGLWQLHGTARGAPEPGRCVFVPPGPPVYMGGERVNTPAGERALRFLDPAAVRGILAAAEG